MALNFRKSRPYDPEINLIPFIDVLPAGRAIFPMNALLVDHATRSSPSLQSRCRVADPNSRA